MPDFTLRRNACLPHLTLLQSNSCSIAQKSGEIVTTLLISQPISFKSGSLSGLARQKPGGADYVSFRRKQAAIKALLEKSWKTMNGVRNKKRNITT